MKQPPKMLVMCLVVTGVVIAGFFWISVQSRHDEAAAKAKAASAPKPFDVASGDTNNEVLKGIVARQRQLAKTNATLAEKNRQLQSQVNAHQQQAMAGLQQSLESEIQQKTKALEAQIHQAAHSASPTAEAAPKTGQYAVGANKADKGSDAMIVSAPDLSAVGTLSGGAHRLSPSHTGNTAPRLPSQRSEAAASPQKPAKPRSYYTIPDGATVGNVSLLSPLIGEVPISGQLAAPAFPFKAIISRKETEKMFAANGVPLPVGLTGTILQGYSVGGMSLGCARAYVMKLLFVFSDGHFEVFPKDKAAQTSATKVYPTDAIGYLSNPYNNACIVGKYITDAPKVIASFMALGAGEGAGAAIAQAQTQTYNSFANATTTTTFNDNLGKYAAGLGINEGAKEALSWYKARVGSIFDAIFVASTKAGHPRRLIFNVTRTVTIDLNQAGRRLNDAKASQMAARDTTFE